tara:strand:+ start:193 stop:357 length:165 start_codon:yes stop_codon:yes gene_type:complete
MKVKLLQEWIGKPAGAVIELDDTKAKRLIKTKLVAKVAAKKVKRKVAQPKECKR